MTKPILIVRFPHIEGKNFDLHLKHLFEHQIASEYHVLVTKENSIGRVEFETHNVLNATDIDLEQLRNELQEQFNK